MSSSLTLARWLHLRHLRDHRLRSALTLAGITTGVALVFATAVLNSSVEASVRTAVDRLTGNADLEIAAASEAGIAEDAVVTARAVDGVAAALPVLRPQTTIHGTEAAASAVVLGVTPGVSSLVHPATADRLQMEGTLGPEGVVLNEGFATFLGASRGESVVVDTPSGQQRVVITGTLDAAVLSGLNGGNAALMPLGFAQRLFDRVGTIDAVYVAVADDADIDAVAGRLDEVVGGAATVGKPAERVESLLEGYNVIAALTTLTGWVALAVALLVVHNTMAMAVADRRHELAVALSLGASRRQVISAFVLEGIVLGLVGALVGIAAGFALVLLLVPETTAISSELLPITPQPEVAIPATAVLLALCGGVAVGAVAAGSAARRVVSMTPLEVFRPTEAAGTIRAGSGSRRLAVAGAGTLVAAVIVGALAVARGTSPMLTTTWLLAWLAGFGLLLPWLVPVIVGWLRRPLHRHGGPITRLAVDSLGHHPGRTALAVASLALPLGMVIGVGGALRSYDQDLRHNAERSFSAPLYVVADQRQGGQPLHRDLHASLADIDGVAHVSEERELSFQIDDEQVLVLASSLPDLVSRGPGHARARLDPEERSIAATLDGGQIVVSKLLAHRLGVHVGDALQLPTPNGSGSFTVGDTRQGWGPLPTIDISIDTYRQHWNDPTVGEFGLYLTPQAQTSSVRAQVETLLDTRGLSAQVHSRGEQIQTMLDPLQALLGMADALLVVALVVAALTIANTSFASVLERRWELAMVQTVGMSRRSIARMLLIETFLVGLVGAAAAVVLGIVTGIGMLQAADTALALSIPFRPPPSLIISAIACAALIAALASLIPRRLAARAPIIDSLRVE